MKTVSRIDDIPLIEPPIVLTIGMFDGVHIGQRHLLESLKPLGALAVVTFANHPLPVLYPSKEVMLLTTPEEKIERLEKVGVDLCIMLTFDEALAHTPYDVFLKAIYEKIPFEKLVVGMGTALGKNREGTIEKCSLLGEALGFSATSTPKFEMDGAPVSSGRIRKLLQTGNHELAKKYLGW
ncbi:MAG: putative bifunctional riboflavin kinase/FMN adenylyltransferase [Chlamydiia bacterium]|nr:putative bifunctional riboflavin kinase/FMN adenylyltransferase [Chlamydiia bacterium]MCH9615164.1 putative bifunctional riboflavin kinase/FMN adenylyltransferase [Chlamydiia bacterium]MCH9628514.1 putative bifunctional riboflavin kinase/FMN adenylyltransferase [Chlamydiia bacterium]